MEEEDNFKCNLCPNKYRYEGTLKTHIMVKHCKSFSYNCDQCEYHQSSVGVDLKASKDPPSKDRGPGELQMVWNQSESVNTASNPTSVVDRGRGVEEQQMKPFPCNQCDYSCKNASTLKFHKVVHSDEKPISCKQCDFSTKLAHNLKAHLIVHTKEKPFICNQCNYTFKRAANMKAHLFLHSEDNAYSCDQCDYSFKTAKRLKRHLLSHSEENPFSCANTANTPAKQLTV